MSDHRVRAPRWLRLAVAALLTVIFAVVLVKSVQSDGRSLGFAFGVNWLLMAWAIVVMIAVIAFGALAASSH